MDERKGTGPALRRELGLLDAVGIGIGAIIGAGIFVVTGIAAGAGGASIIIGILIAGAAATANALSSAELAATYPQSGGTYEYGYRVLHPWAGYVAGWMFLASKTAAAGTVALGLAGYLESLWPALEPRAVAVGAIVVFTAVNYLGVRKTSRLNLAIVAATLAALLAFIVAGLPAVRPTNFRPFAPFGWRGTLESAALLFFAYTGYARIATLGEEVHDPETTIPRAIGITLGGTGLLYLVVVVVAVGAVGATALTGTAAPLIEAAKAFPMPWSGRVIAVGGVTAMLGVLLSQILGLSRMAFAMARRGDLPNRLARIDPERGVPRSAILAVGAAAALVAGLGRLQGVAAAASFTILVYYGIANLAALRMPGDRKLYSDLVPAFGLATCIALAFSLSMTTITTGLLVLLVGMAIRIAMRGLGRRHQA